MAVTNISGAISAINTYDEYGIVGGSSGNDISTRGRFRYTGQAWLPELGLYYYKARMYSPTLGRFMQTDPIGYGDGMNMYNYVGGDPINGVDPTGLACNKAGYDTEEACTGEGGTWSEGPLIVVSARKISTVDSGPGWFGGIPYSGVGVYYGLVSGVPTELTVEAPQNGQDRCSGGRATSGLGGGLTFFGGDRGFTFNLEIGIAHGTSAGSGQLYIRGSIAGLGGGGAFGGAGLNASGGITSNPLSTGYTNDKILAFGAAKVFGGELFGSTGSTHGGAIRDPSISASLRGGYGGYIATGDRHTVTAVLIGGC